MVRFVCKYFIFFCCYGESYFFSFFPFKIYLKDTEAEVGGGKEEGKERGRKREGKREKKCTLLETERRFSDIHQFTPQRRAAAGPEARSQGLHPDL